MRALYISLLALGLAACTPMQWARPGTTENELRADAADCRQWAWAEAWRRTWFFPHSHPLMARDMFGRPLRLRDDPFMRDPFNDRFFEESRLADQCLRSRGYELVPADGPR